mmetsp:Transcript_35288/g.99901  ORF Transcript_35288/g.99901 Transcript_35288/m.99901 type:complete len:122 (+) Transcript_35288:156-521(+)|eukprot:CAMPEP_0117670414 /NCGR_PEP_ID=MMETSP0804-20121206/12736_1 /TAXON_ID=1074897 /ORGANISM="Tetraselmis astigmatica, Strain CCMP880" /LENGTH=121 /DNA_ID=CAMNT_0005478703 /DNA_START=237 /DNA_END=602 /DNA_ORIENTATION=-
MAAIPPGLPEFLNILEDYSPTIPDELTASFLERNGYPCQDKRLIRLVSVAAQCFAAQVSNDALQVCKKRKRMQQKKQRDEGYNPKDKRMVLTAEELAEVLQEYGVNLKVPPYFAENKGPAK